MKAVLAGDNPPYSNLELDQLAAHCTVQEDAAKKVERQLRKSEAALLLHPRVGQRFDALVTGSGTHEIWVRIFEPPAEGRLRGDLPELKIGQSIRVCLVSTSVEQGFIDLVLENQKTASTESLGEIHERLPSIVGCQRMAGRTPVENRGLPLQ